MLTRKEVIEAIRKSLKARSGKSWSVTGGRGTAYGWLTISAPPARLNGAGNITEEDRAELARLLGKDTIHHQGESVPSSSAHYTEYMDRAAGLTPSVIGQQYWD